MWPTEPCCGTREDGTPPRFVDVVERGQKTDLLSNCLNVSYEVNSTGRLPTPNGSRWKRQPLEAPFRTATISPSSHNVGNMRTVCDIYVPKSAQKVGGLPTSYNTMSTKRRDPVHPSGGCTLEFEYVSLTGAPQMCIC